MFFNKKAAPEIVKIGKDQWINSAPLTLKELQGKVVLLDFWTYSCVNCLRTLPVLKEMWKKYKDKNVVIIGIHTPEFEFEKELQNVKKAVQKHDITYPIANDPDQINWERYGNRYWPRAALINAQGELIMEHIGESGYDEIEARIITELKKMNLLKEGMKIKEEKRYYAAEISPETYAGARRNNGIGSRRVCTKKGCEEYYDPGNYSRDVIYLQGDWKQHPEFLEFKGDAGHIAFRYHAREVNVVLDGKGAVEILLNNKPITEENAGDDIEMKSSKSVVLLNGPDMYRLVSRKNYHEAVLKIIPCKGMKVYAYTFG